jgi:5-methylcytosine-specific restriction endonuclease McrA
VHFAAIQALDAELRSLASDERKGVIAFLRRLDVLDREKAYAALNCRSAFEYLTKELHLCEGTAAGRVTAMRLIRRFPVLEEALEDGRLNPSQLLVLGPVLTEGNLAELVRRASHLTKEATRELVVSLRPREVPADGLRQLPAPAARPAVLPSPAPGNACPSRLDIIGPSLTEAPVEPPVLLLPGPLPSRPAERSRLEPVAARRWQWRVTLDERLKAKLDRLKGLLAHKVPDGDLEKLLEIMLDDAIEKEGKKRGHVAPSRPRKPAPPKAPTPGRRQPVPLPVRREVLQRDGHRCTFLGADGQRCPCTEGLEMDHLEPARETGSSGAEDLTTRCRVHNQWRAYQSYGAGFMERRIEQARREREARRARGRAGGGTARAGAAPPPADAQPALLLPEAGA